MQKLLQALTHRPMERLQADKGRVIGAHHMNLEYAYPWFSLGYSVSPDRLLHRVLYEQLPRE